VSNSGPLIHLAQMSGLDLLFMIFDVVYIPEAVFKEVVEDGLEKGYPDAIVLENEIKNGRIVVQKVHDKQIPSIPAVNLHEGEIETIRLAMSLSENPVVLDDEEARLIARMLKLKVIGSVGIIIKCVKSGYISKKVGLINIKRLNDVMYLSSDVFSKAMEFISNL